MSGTLPKQAAGGVLVFPTFANLDVVAIERRRKRNRRFADAFDECEAACRRHLGWSLHDRFLASKVRLTPQAIGGFPTLLTASQIADARVLADRGIVPAAILGLCAGEVAAAHVAGVMTLDEAFQVRACFEGFKAENRALPSVRHAYVHASWAEVVEVLKDSPDFAAFSDVTPGITLLGLFPGADARVISTLPAAWRVRESPLSDFPWHTPAVEGFAEYLRARLPAFGRAPSVRYYSGTDGQRLTSAPRADHWGRVGCHPLRIGISVREMLADGFRTFMEVGPSDGSMQMIEAFATAHGVTVSTSTTGVSSRGRGRGILGAVRSLKRRALVAVGLGPSTAVPENR